MQSSMERESIGFILEAIEEVEDYYPLLERQHHLDQETIHTAVSDLKEIFTLYQKQFNYGIKH